MPFVHEIQIRTQGFPGAPGFTNLYFETTVSADHEPQFVAARNFLVAIREAFPNIWSGQIASNGRVLEASTGALGLFTTPSAASVNPITGNLTTTFGSGVSGAAISWLTGTVGPNRLIRGRTFLVPAASGAYASDGTILPAVRQNIQLAANGLIAANVGFGVWRRPVLGAGGVLAPALSARVSPMAVFLSSRRS